MASPTSRFPAAEGSVLTTWLPLTTVYPILPRCQTNFYMDPQGDIFAYDPNHVDLTLSTKCWPSQAALWWNQQTGIATVTSLGPFLCPEAYTIAVTTVVNPGSTLTGCCPGGYALTSLTSQPNPLQCTSAFASGARFTFVSSWSPSANGYTTITTVLDKDQKIYGVQVNGYNFEGNSAEPTSTGFGWASGSSSSSEPSSGSVSATSTATSKPHLDASGATVTSAVSAPSMSNNSRLTTGTQIGLAIGLSVAVVIIAALACVVFFMRRQKKVHGTLLQGDSLPSSSDINMGQVIKILKTPQEMPVTSTRVREMHGSTSYPELDGNHRR